MINYINVLHSARSLGPVNWKFPWF